MSAGVLRAMLEKEKNEFRKFVSLVKQMREAQDAFNISVSADNIEDILSWKERLTNT
jgi:hypothetical protein